ncbi:decapping endonuclease targeting mRNA [Marasmius crinis-equi]|uniref:Decapping nuclease n=1 Tax=Marasmius crinis-equi TaxID=585013 RepID=A0ABR3FHN0_9AGAR
MSKRPLDSEHENGDSQTSPKSKQPRLSYSQQHPHPSLPPKPQVHQHEHTEPRIPPSNEIYLSYPPLNQPQKAPPIQQPTPLISFSYDEEHIQEFTDSALRYYRPIPTEFLGGGESSGQSNQRGRGRGRGGWNGNREEREQEGQIGNAGVDLNYGYERWIRRPEERGRLDSLLKAVDKVCFREGSDGIQEGKMRLRDISIVAWRGVMTKILTAPYEDRDGWSLNCMVVDGTLYLEEHHNEEKLREKNDIPEKQRRNMYYGYAFESFCTTDSPAQSSPSGSAHDSQSSENGPSNANANSSSTQERDHPLWGGDVNTNVQWCSVVKTKLGDLRILIGGEVDCVKVSLSS